MDLYTRCGTGVPVASSIFDISLDTKCAFFELFDSKVEIIVNLSLSGDILDRPAHSKELDLIGPQELMERVVSKCRPSCWENVTENLRTIRRGRFDTFYGHPIFGPTYHPLHLILVD